MVKTRPPGEATKRRRPETRQGARFGVVNIAAFICAAATIIGGYVLLDRGSVTAAPLLLVLGYAVLIPAGLLWGLRSSGE